jgi:hypothetical protein
MKKLILSAILFAMLLLTGCNEDSPLEPGEDQVVVQAYIYANEPVEGIRLSFMLPLDVEEGTEMSPVNDALVKLIKNGQSYELENSPGDSGYYHYSDTDLTIETNDVFNLEIEHGDKILTAQTAVPAEPQNVSLSSTTMRVPTIEDIIGGGVNISELLVTVNWDNENEDLFYVTSENLEANPTSVNSDLGDRIKSRIFPPTRSDEFTLNPLQFTHYGTHLVKVYRVNQEYADLYETQEQDSRSLNEPLTNIENGLGVFSAFHSNTDSLVLEVIPY